MKRTSLLCRNIKPSENGLLFSYRSISLLLALSGLPGAETGLSGSLMLLSYGLSPEADWTILWIGVTDL